MAHIPGFRSLGGTARGYVNLATGEIVSRRDAEQLTERGYGAGRLIGRWRGTTYKTMRGVMGRIGRLPPSVSVFAVARGALLQDSGNDLAGTTAWKTVIPVTRSDTLKTFTREEILERAHELFVAGTIDRWLIRWR